MEAYNASNVLNGTYGECWIDDAYMAQTTGLEAKTSVKKTDVALVGRLAPGKKVTGIENKGTVKMNHVTSEMKTKIAEYLKQGKTPYFTIVSKLADPDAINNQAERIKFTGVTFDEVTLVDFENGKLGEESYPFEYEDFEFLDTINV